MVVSMMTATGSVTCGTVHLQVALDVDQVNELAAGILECPVCSECCAPPFRRHALATALRRNRGGSVSAVLWAQTLSVFLPYGENPFPGWVPLAIIRHQ